MLMIHVDDGIVIDPDNSKIKEVDMLAKFEVQDKGDLSDYLRKPPDGSTEFVQMQLSESILEVLKLVEHGGGSQAKTYDPPCKHNGKMNQDEGGKEFGCSWDYKSVIGKLICLEKPDRGNITVSVHPCAQYMSQTMSIYGEAVRRMGRYLLGTWDKDFLVWPNTQQSFKYYVEAEYCEYVMMHHGCPILLASRLWSAFAHSAIKSKYVALLTAFAVCHTSDGSLEGEADCVYNVGGNLHIKCKLFADNSGVFEPAKTATSLNFTNPYSCGKISPSKMKECEDIGFLIATDLVRCD
jgi:hypothetical protein